MEINLEKWKYELRHQKKHLVHTDHKKDEGLFTQCFRRIFSRYPIPIMFSTNPNLYKSRNLNQATQIEFHKDS